MNTVLKVTRIGNSAGVILPRAVLTRLQVVAGDTISLVENDNGFELRPHADDFEAQMTAARDVMANRRRALRELAK